ncbi:hypothetical protein CRE_15756 [Caenorhabditis remanei]|uniref:Cytochrome b561 domain-containing protein n=1 Tax=Caenorhabditis remanei TaxID=31234 RepID=E3NIU3_CAERE|nr:hypothetical protein CRE_15756 [Caenorhabditis remanei]
MIYKFLLVFAIIRPTFSQFSSQFDASQCEISKGCHIPEPSQSNGMGVAWNLLDDETLELELFVNAEQENGRYVAVGFSDDEQMGNEPVIECSAIGTQPASMKFSFDKTTGKGNQRIPGDHSAHFTDTTASFQNGVLYCRSKVKVSGSEADPNVFKFDPSKDYYLLLANGKTTAKGLGYHKEMSSVSRKVRLAENSPGFDNSECGKTKGCTIPHNCAYMNGETIGASYRVVDSTQIEFEIFGPANTTVNQNVYVALGFSDHEKMDRISVIECSQIGSEQSPTMKFSYNPDFYNARIAGEPAIRAKLIKQSIGRIADGQIYCKGVVNVGGDADNSQIFKWNQTQGYQLMFAAGFTNVTDLTPHTGSCPSGVTYLDQINGFDDSTCGDKKGCFMPTDCVNVTDCSGIRSSWAVLPNNQLHVEITGNVDSPNQYVAMGFSTSGKMGNTSLIECSSFNNGEYSMTFSYNYVTEHYQNIRPVTDVSGLFTNRRVQLLDGVLYCSADVKVQGIANEPSVFQYEPTTNYTIIMAKGVTRTNGTQKSLGYHRTVRSFTPYSQTLTAYAPPATPTPPSGTGSFDASECTHSKACYQPNANDAVSYRVISDSSIEFEFSSTQSSSTGVYLALGFSADGNMGPADVIECSSLGNQPLSMKFSSNSASTNSRIPGEEAIRATYITNTQISFVDGKIYCKGTVRSDGNANTQIFKYTPNQQYYLVVAKGQTSASGLSYHGNVNRFKSSQRLLTDMNAGNGTSSTTLLILHAIFMTIAWMTMVPTAVIFARVLRSSWPTVKPGGLLIWFHIHRGANLIGIALMIAGFVFILVHKDWKFTTAGWGGKHAIIGIIALCLAWLQPFISTLRCSPNDPRRPIFNYIHRGIGVIAMVLATTAICIAGYHFTPSRHVAQLILALIPISVIFALSLFFIIFNNVVDVDTKSFTKNNGNSARTENIPMRPTSQKDSETTWTITNSTSSPTTENSNQEVPAEKKKLWVNRFREFVVYGAVLIFVAVGTILAVFFGLAFTP